MPLKGSIQTTRAAEELRQKIINGQLLGGERLFEVAIADELNISRTPVREAMSRLTEEGILERCVGGGFAVRSFSVDDILDAIEIRGAMEGIVVRIAAERRIPKRELLTLKSIAAAIDKCTENRMDTPKTAEYAKLNTEFHNELAKLSGSDLLRRELELAKLLPFASPSAFIPDYKDWDSFEKATLIAQHQHHMILRAIENHEGARAETLTREHAKIAQENLQQLLLRSTDSKGRVPSLALLRE